MTIRARIFLVAAASLAASCATPEQRADEMAGYIADNYGPTCTKLGYALDTDGHRNCMVSMYQADQARVATPWYSPPVPGYRIRR